MVETLRTDLQSPSEERREIAVSPRRIDYTRTLPVRTRRSSPLDGWQTILLLGIFGAFAALFYINFSTLLKVWSSNPNFSMGFAIPFISAYFVYLHWDTLVSLKPKPAPVGLLMLILGAVSQVVFLVHGQIQFSHLSMFVVLFGGVLWLLGWEHMQILWLPICYLIFMINPPQALYVKLTSPLQEISASLGVHILPFFGVNAFRTATQVHVQSGTHWYTLNVVRACSGIRMLTTFFALCIALGYSTNRPMWQKILLAVCGLPIAIACNSLRVALSGVIYVTLGSEWARGSTHASLGLLMLIPAFLMLLAIAWFIGLIERNLFVNDAPVSGSVSGGRPT